MSAFSKLGSLAIGAAVAALLPARTALLRTDVHDQLAHVDALLLQRRA